MIDSELRTKRAFKNIIVSLMSQIVVLICGLIVPKLMINGYGSEAYGATASIAQFLAYISLLEGGVGGVARAALYKPLADSDMQRVSNVIYEVQKFFKFIGYVFIVYAFILALSFKMISNFESLDWISSFLLVIAISISTIAQYFFGISNATLIQASQRIYVTNIINISTMILNTIAVVILVNKGFGLITVKFVSGFVYILRPLLMNIYVSRTFPLPEAIQSKSNYLDQKWSGISQHIAFFLHSNTDIAILTIFANLKTVSVYAVYYMVVSQINNIVASFSTGMEALFGDMIARKEIDKLKGAFGYYETLISIVSITLFSTTALLIVPFVRLYTNNISDANYVQPIFAFILTLAYYVNVLMKPYHNMIIAAGHFRETRFAAYGEAIINILLSIIFVNRLGLVGVALGTFLATLFRFVYYVMYLSRCIIFKDIKEFIKRITVNTLTYVLIFFCGLIFIKIRDFTSYIMWAVAGFIISLSSLAIVLLVYYIVYKNESKVIINRITSKYKDLF